MTSPFFSKDKVQGDWRLPQVWVCSYCHVMQRMAAVEPLSLEDRDIKRYIEHLKLEHGVRLKPEVAE